MAAQDPLGTLKAYLFPILLSGFTMLVWNDIREIKQDVKLLMAQSNIDKTRIDNLERLMYKSPAVSISLNKPFPPDKHAMPPRAELVAVLPDNKLTPKPYETFN